MEPLAIRPARPEDTPTLVEFQLLMARETEGLELDPAVVTRGVQAVFEEPARGAYWVAERGGEAPKIAGSLLTTPEWSDWRAATVLWIQSVYVVPGERGRGVYRALHEHLRSVVQESPGLAGLRLYVDRRNTGAQRVYEQLEMSAEHYAMYEWMK
ncbi:MAG TPA: GNAT family N-acetyltransferase [Thermoanaerobaculia bacterium]|nr:GNAT family N-acetyltransferase [Thermoanaerobaculia bacterium]